MNLIATPDLLYHRDGEWVWRETKTSGAPLWAGHSLLRSYPQLAVGVLLLAAGAAGADPGGRIELEHLQEDDCALEEIDAGQPDVIEEARTVVSELLEPLLNDVSFFPARPGNACVGCEVLRWCKEGRTQ